MEPKSSNDPGSRIDALQGSGRLSPADAGALRSAYAAAPNPQRSSSSQPAVQSFPDFAHLFLSGVIDEATLRQRSRQRGVQMGVLFGVLFGIGMMLTNDWSHPWWKRIAMWAPGGMAAGALFGWMMYRSLLLPAVERLVRLRREAGTLQPLGAVDAGQCPTCRAEDFDVWTWKKPVVLHYILNPALVVNELLLGQRIPAHTKVCRHCHTFSVDCPHCNRAIDTMQWGGRRAFFHWGDLHCPHCGGALPTLSNALAWLVRAPFRLVAKLFTRGGAA